MTGTVVERQRVVDVFLVAFGMSVDVKLLRDGAADQRLGAQREVGAEGQVEIDTDTARELGDVVAPHDTVAAGDGSIGIPLAIRFSRIAYLAQVG